MDQGGFAHLGLGWRINWPDRLDWHRSAELPSAACRHFWRFFYQTSKGSVETLIPFVCPSVRFEIFCKELLHIGPDLHWGPVAVGQEDHSIVKLLLCTNNQHNWFQNLYRWGWLILQAWWRAGMSETTLGVSTDAFGCRCSSPAWYFYFCSSAAVTEQVSQMTEKASPVTTVLSHVCSCDMGYFTVDCLFSFDVKKEKITKKKITIPVSCHCWPPYTCSTWLLQKAKQSAQLRRWKNEQFSSLHIFNIWDEGGIL